MSTTRRAALGLAILSFGLAAEAAVERDHGPNGRPLRRLAGETIPFVLGDWVGVDEPVDPKIARDRRRRSDLNRRYTLEGGRGRSSGSGSTTRTTA